MSSPESTQDRARTGPAKAQAQKLLRTMCNVLLPIIQRAGGKKTMKAHKMHFGNEADEFVKELEKFISNIISCSQLRSQDSALEATNALGKDSFDYLEGTSWFWDLEILVTEDEIMDESSDGSRNSEPLSFDDNELEIYGQQRGSDKQEAMLQRLRSHVSQKMPLRLLCFEPDDLNLKISLLERADVYNYLATKFLKYDTWPDSWFEDHAQYAILSHTWTQNPGELTYRDWQSSSLNDKNPKCRKLIKFCKAAWEDHGITLGWIDALCINKESSSELDESIRSMYTWYRNAAVCITYLAGTAKLSDMRNDRWFSRGWTLQEMIAPGRIKYYNMDWIQLSKQDMDSDMWNDLILEEIRHATTITRDELQYFSRLSISRKMQLAAKRQVTREENTAYCLMGIFNVSISTAYGEGADRAFFRLMEEIFRSTKDVSAIFNWAGSHNPGSITSLFPSSPSKYLNCLETETYFSRWPSWRPIQPLTLTHLGLRIPLLLMPAAPSHELVSNNRPIGDYHATVSIPNIFVSASVFHLLDKGTSGPEGLYDFGWGVKISLTFGVLNVEEEGTSIRISKTCLAVFLQRPVSEGIETSSVGYEKISTNKPIAFELKKTRKESDVDWYGQYERYYQVERNKLAKHGMKLVTLNL